MDELGELGLDGLAIHLGGQESLYISRLNIGNNLGQGAGKAGELRVGSNEVGLAGKLDQGTGLTILGDISGDGTLVGLATGLLSGLGKAVLAENVNGGVHVAVGLDEGLLALHHRRVGHLAKLLNHSSGDLGHDGSFQMRGERTLTYQNVFTGRQQRSRRPSQPRKSAPCQRQPGRRRQTART